MMATAPIERQRVPASALRSIRLLALAVAAFAAPWAFFTASSALAEDVAAGDNSMREPARRAVDAAAAPPSRSDKESRIDPPQTMVFVFDEAAIFVDFQLRLQREGILRSWRRSVEKAVNASDLDKNGALNDDELWRLTASGLLGDRVALVDYEGRDSNVVLARPRRDEAAGGVTAASLTDDLMEAGCGPLRLEWFSNSDQFVDGLAANLDRDHDGLLSAVECAQAPELVQAFDQDDTESIEASDMIVQPPQNLAKPPGPTPGAPAAIGILGAGLSVDELAERMVRRLGVPGADGPRLPRDALAYGAAAFAIFDRDGDQGLDLDEVRRLLRDAPAQARLSGNLLNELLLGLTPSGLDDSIRLDAAEIDPSGVASTLEGHLAIRTPRMKINWRLSQASLPPKVRRAARQFYERLDSDKSGDLDADEWRRATPRWAQADLDRDGKLTLREFENFTDNVGEALRLRWRVIIRDLGPSLFAMLDVNEDGRLSLRELSALSSLSGAWDTNRDGQLEPDEVPRVYVVQLSPDSFLPNGLPSPPFPEPSATVQEQRAGRGPIWFLGMDRNQDGDISLREFLGPTTAFRRLDANGDGLIDLHEASQASAEPADKSGRSASLPQNE